MIFLNKKVFSQNSSNFSDFEKKLLTFHKNNITIRKRYDMGNFMKNVVLVFCNRNVELPLPSLLRHSGTIFQKDKLTSLDR